MNTTQETEFDYQRHLKESARGPSEINRGTKAREKRREAAKTRISQNGQLSRVLKKIQEIAEKSADGDYIYRGEPECYCKVSSSLYRKYSKIDVEHFDIEVVQDEILKEAKKFTREIDDFEILTELQHYGYNTNLIDFTTDCHIALFFACYLNFDRDGRIVLLQKTNSYVVEPQSPINRIISQKSIFVRPPKGFILPDHVINIPKDLKKSILDYLSKYHGISIETIYNDLHGFIRYQNVHQSAYAEFYAGLTCQNEKDYSKAIEYYRKAIELNPRIIEAYNNRGVAYGAIDEFDRAIADYDKTIELDPEYAKVYYNRGIAYMNKDEAGLAIADYDKTIELDPEYAEVYYNRGIAYMNKDEAGLAVKDFSKAIDLNPKYAEAYSNRGVAYIKKGEFSLAVKDFSKAIDLNPKYAEVHYYRGNAYIDKGEFGLAVKDFSKVIDLNPKYAEAYYYRGVAYIKKGEFDLAVKDFSKVIDLNPKYAEVHYYRGICWLYLKNWQEVKSDLIAAKSMGMDIIAVFRNVYESVEAFEKKNGIKLPKDIAAILTP